MTKCEIQILKYLYEKGEEHQEFQGYKQGVFYQLPFAVEEMIDTLGFKREEIIEACNNLANNFFVNVNDTIIAVTEIGWAHYIENYYVR